MLNLFKKSSENKNKECIINAPVDGAAMLINELDDGVFSEKLMGEGFAVLPESNEVYSPVNGQVISIFPTKHAICILSEQGIEILVHMGIDTVTLDGAPFQIYVKEGDKIKTTTKIADMDVQDVKQKGIRTEIIVVITNSKQIENFHLTTTGKVNHMDALANCVKVKN